MRDARMTRALRRTFDRTACVFRPLSDGTEPGGLCRYSLRPQPQRTHERARGARRGRGAVREPLRALALHAAEVWLRLGDRVAVSDKSGRVYHARASDSVRYPSHCVTVVEVTEVSVPASQESAEGGTADQKG